MTLLALHIFWTLNTKTKTNHKKTTIYGRELGSLIYDVVDFCILHSYEVINKVKQLNSVCTYWCQIFGSWHTSPGRHTPNATRRNKVRVTRQQPQSCPLVACEVPQGLQGSYDSIARSLAPELARVHTCSPIKWTENKPFYKSTKDNNATDSTQWFIFLAWNLRYYLHAYEQPLPSACWPPHVSHVCFNDWALPLPKSWLGISYLASVSLKVAMPQTHVALYFGLAF